MRGNRLAEFISGVVGYNGAGYAALSKIFVTTETQRTRSLTEKTSVIYDASVVIFICMDRR